MPGMGQQWLVLLVCIAGNGAFAQPAPSYADFEKILNAQREAVHEKLRHSVVNYRDLLGRSCAIGNRLDCDLAALKNVELVLLDLEYKFDRASRYSDKFKKAKEAADEARGKISELFDALKE